MDSGDDLILRARGLSKSYQGKRVIDALSLEVARGEVVALLGSNGAGKTTAFYAIIGLIRPDEGRVFFEGKDVTKKALYERARMGMGYLSQEPSVFRNLTVEENILSILETLPIVKAERKRRLEMGLRELHLEKLAENRAVTLSGGERRRLEIARSLVTDPTLLLLDEPFANIDPITIREVKQLILHLKSKGISILITDHNAREISSIVERSYLIRGGRVVGEGSISQLLQNWEARTTYFGEDFEL